MICLVISKHNYHIMQKYGDKMLFEIFNNTTIKIYKQAESVPNELGIVSKELILLAETKAERSQLTMQQSIDRYGLNTTQAVEYNVNVNLENADGMVLMVSDNGKMYQVERVVVNDAFLCIGKYVTLACTEVDA